MLNFAEYPYTQVSEQPVPTSNVPYNEIILYQKQDNTVKKEVEIHSRLNFENNDENIEDLTFR